MTEADWLAATDPRPMLEFLRGKASDRKLRLFGVACCRRLWAELQDDFRSAVDVAERFADGGANNKELGTAKQTTGALLAASARPPDLYRLCGAAWSTTRNAPTAAIYPCWVFTDEADRFYQLATIRDIFGNPFRPVVCDPTWRTATTVALATGIYAERAFDRMPALANALQEAGCAIDDILTHCRGEGPHARGCWVVDLLLGKE